MPAEARRLSAGEDHDAQEAELRAAEDRPRATLQRQGSYGLYSGRRAHAAGALDRAHSRWARAGLARRALPHYPRDAGLPGRERPQAEPQPVRSEEVISDLRF